MNTLNENILMAIECPACLEYMNAPIFVCMSGHSICHKCWKGLSTCPTCRKDLSDTRSYTLETVAELLFYPCDNNDNGCNEYIRQNEKEDHLVGCSYRNYHCKFPKCTWKGRRVSIEDHYFSNHQQSVLVGPECQCWWKNSKFDVYLMRAHGEIFYVIRINVKNCMYWMVHYIGNSEDAIQYCFEITIYSDQFQHRKITISENCQDDIKEDVNEIIESGYAAGVPVPVLDSYKNEIGHVWYNIKIKDVIS